MSPLKIYKRIAHSIATCLSLIFLTFSGSIYASGGGDDCEGCIAFAPVMWPSLDTRATMAMLIFSTDQENCITEPYSKEGSDSILSFCSSDDNSTNSSYNDRSKSRRPADEQVREWLQIFESNPDETNRIAQEQFSNISSYNFAIKLQQLQPFLNALKEASELSNSDKTALLCIALDASCGTATGQAAPEYMAYLDARRSFYAADYAAARQGFEKLAAASTPWIRETSQYNLIRIYLRQSLRLDEYGEADFSKRDPAAAGLALEAIDRYLQLYPTGRYAASAQGLKRRAYWLKDDTVAMMASYEPAIQKAQRGVDIQNTPSLLYELDRYVVFPQALYQSRDQTVNPANNPDENPADHINWQIPFVATAQVLMRLRPDNEKTVPLPDLLLHEKDFVGKGYGDAFRLLVLSTQFYDQHNYQAVVDGTKDWEAVSTHPSYVAYSLLTLRAYALEALSQWEQSATMWAFLRNMPTASQLFRTYAEKAQAVNLELAGNVAGIFAKDSPITNTTYREAAIKSSASAHVLEQLIAMEYLPKPERQLAATTLLQKSLVAQDAESLARYYHQYSQMFEDKKAWCPEVPEVNEATNEAGKSLAYECQNWSAAIDSMASAKPTADARLCFTNWLRQCGETVTNSYGIPQDEVHTQASRYPLSGQFADDDFRARYNTNLYQQVLDDPSATANQRAYALYRSIQCFYHAHASFTSTRCAGLGDGEYSVEKRKAWFNTLKKKYKNTPWAEEQRVYW